MFSSEHHGHLENAFHQQDKEKTGVLTADEMKFCLKEAGLRLTSVRYVYLTLTASFIYENIFTRWLKICPRYMFVTPYRTFVLVSKWCWFWNLIIFVCDKKQEWYPVQRLSFFVQLVNFKPYKKYVCELSTWIMDLSLWISMYQECFSTALYFIPLSHVEYAWHTHMTLFAYGLSTLWTWVQHMTNWCAMHVTRNRISVEFNK